MGDGEGALSDAYKCRMMRPDWAKGCYRLAAAHMLLGVRYTPTLPKCWSLLIHIIFIWCVVVLYAWTCCVLGAQASLWRSSGCAEVGSWKWRNWERTTVTCYLLFVPSVLLEYVYKNNKQLSYVKWQQAKAMCLDNFPFNVSLCHNFHHDYSWHLFRAFGFFRKAIELMKISTDEDEQWSVAGWLWE
jgi:hypothetical protein